MRSRREDIIDVDTHLDRIIVQKHMNMLDRSGGGFEVNENSLFY